MMNLLSFMLFLIPLCFYKGFYFFVLMFLVSFYLFFKMSLYNMSSDISLIFSADIIPIFWCSWVYAFVVYL